MYIKYNYYKYIKKIQYPKTRKTGLPFVQINDIFVYKNRSNYLDCFLTYVFSIRIMISFSNFYCTIRTKCDSTLVPRVLSPLTATPPILAGRGGEHCVQGWCDSSLSKFPDTQCFLFAMHGKEFFFAMVQV